MVHTDLKFENVLVDILSDNLKNIINKVNALNLYNKYNDLLTKNTPQNYNELDKAKKKKVKRKVKDRTLKNIEKYIRENNCLKFDKESIEEQTNAQTIYDLENINFDTFKLI